jgi:hypothetical protein
MEKISALLFVICASCSSMSKNQNESDFSDKSSYKLKVGETFKIYYSTNSCCYLCLKVGDHDIVKKISEKKVKNEGEEECARCNSVFEITFKAIKKWKRFNFYKNNTCIQSV